MADGVNQRFSKINVLKVNDCGDNALFASIKCLCERSAIWTEDLGEPSTRLIVSLAGTLFDCRASSTHRLEQRKTSHLHLLQILRLHDLCSNKYKGLTLDRQKLASA